MNAQERLQLIELRIKKIREIIVAQKNKISELTLANEELTKQLEEERIENAELKSQIEIADMANQLGSEATPSKELRLKLDKYIREVDSVIEALKLLE